LRLSLATSKGMQNRSTTVWVTWGGMNLQKNPFLFHSTMIPHHLSMTSHANCKRLVSSKHVRSVTATGRTMLMNPTRTPTPSQTVIRNSNGSCHTPLRPRPNPTHPGTRHQAWPNMGTGIMGPPPTMGSSGTARTRDHRRRARLGGPTCIHGLQQGQDLPGAGA